MKHIKFFPAIFFFCGVFLFSSCKKDKGSTPTPTEKSFYLKAQKGNAAGIYDQHGRFYLLRGVNYNVLGDYWAANEQIPTQAEHSSEQFRIMASYGINCIRLLFSWSALEPQPGQYSSSYIQKIASIIDDANQFGIKVMIDLHQDAYSKHIFSKLEDNCIQHQKGWDGAPAWACITEGQSPCTEDGSRESPRAVVYAWQNLWDNTSGIQDNLIKSWGHLIATIGNKENVIGYDLINEPSLGYKSLQDQQKKLSNFYSKLIQEIRSVEKSKNIPEKIIFFEPAVTFNGQQIPAVVGPNFTNDQNIVFAPHNYFEVITPLLTIEQGFTLYSTLAKSYSTVCFIGEWGIYSSPEENAAKMKRFAQQEDQYLMGSTYWQWSQAPGDPHGISWDGQNYGSTSLHLMELDASGQYTGVRNDIQLKILARTRPIAVQGKNIQFESNPDNGHFKLTAKTDQKGITELWIPDFWGYPNIDGKNIIVKNIQEVEGGYVASIEVQSSYEIVIRN